MPSARLLDRVLNLSPDRPLRTLWRSAGYKLRPPSPAAFSPGVFWRQKQILANGEARPDQLSEVLCEIRSGPVPTIVLGGFVPDATESVYLVRGMMLRHGSVFYVNYPPGGFSTLLLLAQLDDLVEELVASHGTTPVVFGISFGCGLIMEWLRRARRADAPTKIRGIVMISPVSCLADVLESNTEKPATLLGRAIAPFLRSGAHGPDPRQIERSRAVFLRMFESGAQNKDAIRHVLTRGELLRIRHRVMVALKGVTTVGAIERVRALAALEPPSGYYTQAIAPLCEAPMLILFAEKESTVLTSFAPSAMLAPLAYLLFPSATVRTVVAHRGSPVQHASLIFHAFSFLPPLSSFYRLLRRHAVIHKRRLGFRRWRRVEPRGTAA